MSVGFVYCLTIPRMEGVVKIGYTCKTMEDRLKQLDNTTCVEPFQVYYCGRVRNPKRVETLIHDYFKQYRIRANREYFEVEPQSVKKLIQIAEASTILDDAPAPVPEEEEEEPIVPVDDDEETPAPPEDEKECLMAKASMVAPEDKLDRYRFKPKTDKGDRKKAV